jgi:hypothetical protein
MNMKAAKTQIAYTWNLHMNMLWYSFSDKTHIASMGTCTVAQPSWRETHIAYMQKYCSTTYLHLSGNTDSDDNLA